MKKNRILIGVASALGVVALGVGGISAVFTQGLPSDASGQPLIGATLQQASSAAWSPAISGSDSHFLIIAHRGFSYADPENTIPAMTAAAKAGADMVEIDVQRTKDGQLVILHDKTLFRTTNVASVFPRRAHDRLATFTLAEVKRLDAGSWKGSQFAGTRVPTLDELLVALTPTTTGVLLELKNPALYPGYEAQVARVLSKHRFVQDRRVFVHSFSAAALKSFHQAAPTVPLGLISKGKPKNLAADGWLKTVNPLATSVTSLSVNQAHSDHLQVFTWLDKSTPDTAAELEHLSDAGVDGVISDRPDLALTELSTSVSASTA